MSDEVRETVFEHASGDRTITYSSSEKKWINELVRLSKKHPAEMDVYVNKDGSIYGHIPADWLKVKPKKKVNMTDEQREASKARLEVGRKKRLQKSLDGDKADSGKDMNAHENDT